MALAQLVPLEYKDITLGNGPRAAEDGDIVVFDFVITVASTGLRCAQ